MSDRKSLWITICLVTLLNVVVHAQSPSPVLSDPSKWGLVADEVTDNSEAVQRMVDGGISSIHFPPGTFRLTRTINIDLDKTGIVSIAAEGVTRIVMDGPGPAFRFVGTHKGTAAPSSFEERVWERQRTPMIDGLEIIGKHPEACGIEADGTMQLTLTRLVVRRTLHAVHLVNRNRNVLIANCHLYENRGIGIFLDNVDLHQINVSACHVSYNDQGGIVSRKGNVRNLHITGCDIESNMSPNTDATANILIDCRDSKSGTAEIAITGNTIQHNSKSPESANIRMIGRGNSIDQQGQKTTEVRWGNMTITGNVLSDVKTNIHLQDCRGVAIDGNTFWMGYRHNLLIESSSNIVIGVNNFDRNPRYDYGDAIHADNAIIFRDCDDCTLQGLHVTQVHAQDGAVVIENSRRFNINGCTILDCDGPGLLLRNVRQSLVKGCLIRDDRTDRTASVSLRVEGGANNSYSDNVLGDGEQSTATP